EIWNTGNLSDLENFQSWCECAETEIDKRMLKRINDDRNSDMAERINALHTQGKKVLAAVGALHMTGNQSLPRLMKQRGFTVERIH
ncbi:MAG: TraB/GumN family protein, partial [Burkholderiales bacterium]